MPSAVQVPCLPCPHKDVWISWCHYSKGLSVIEKGSSEPGCLQHSSHLSAKSLQRSAIPSGSCDRIDTFPPFAAEQKARIRIGIHTQLIFDDNTKAIDGTSHVCVTGHQIDVFYAVMK